MQVRWRRQGGALPSGAPGGRRDRTEDYRFLPRHAAGAFSKVGDGAFSKVGDNEVVAGVAADGSSNADPTCASTCVCVVVCRGHRCPCYAVRSAAYGGRAWCSYCKRKKYNFILLFFGKQELGASLVFRSGSLIFRSGSCHFFGY